MSERTFYRRKAYAAAAAEPRPQDDAHVVSWRALTSFERLDIIAAARRLWLAAARRRPFGAEIELALRKRAH